MKIEVHEIPSSEKPGIVLLRFIPEKNSERKLVPKIHDALRGTSAIAASPKINGEEVLSLMFNLHAEKNKEKKA